MRKGLNAYIALLSALLMLISGCEKNDGATADEAPDPPVQNLVDTDSGEIFSGRDYEVGYDKDTSAVITLHGSSAICSSNAVQISGGRVTITDEGTYIISGTLDDGMIIVNSEKTDKIQLVFSGVTINSPSSAALYVLQSDKVFITLAEGSVNTFSNGGSFVNIDDNNIDAVIFSKEDLTINGSGKLIISSPAGHGIVSKDELTFTGGEYEIEAASHAVNGKDNVCIANASFNIEAGKDGIHAENSDDATLGFVYIESGSFSVIAEGDGISAAAYMQIDGGEFDIVTGGGAENGENKGSSGFGGGRPGGNPFGNSQSSSSQSDTSIKGIKASTDLLINGGSFKINSADDAVHSNAGVTVNGGVFEIASGDDGFHADDTLTVVTGTVNITQSYEGLEGLHVVIRGGDINITATDDGINAAGGTDQSGYGGGFGDMFGGGGKPNGGSSGSSGSIVISGGTIYIKMSGDGIDANGTLEISGGHITVCGPTSGDTAVLDYDRTATINGGTFIGTGSTMMAQSISSSEQGVLAFKVTAGANTEITVKDRNGNTVLSHSPELGYALVVISSPDLVKGETYTVTVGTQSAQFTAN